ncbi:EthD domain-containing protein [Rhizobium leguminosarum]|uniref:EthD domain-containing protein n=1 Tax=Rhizobium leguminosarum TaxID=384 RepID=UPI003D7C189B
MICRPSSYRAETWWHSSIPVPAFTVFPKRAEDWRGQPLEGDDDDQDIFITRRADLSFEEFSDYWVNKHWPLVQTIRPIMENAVRYAQQHSINAVPEGVPRRPTTGSPRSGSKARRISSRSRRRPSRRP